MLALLAMVAPACLAQFGDLYERVRSVCTQRPKIPTSTGRVGSTLIVRCTSCLSLMASILRPASAAHEAGLWVHIWHSAQGFPEAGYSARSYMAYLMDELKIDGIMNHEPDQFPR